MSKSMEIQIKDAGKWAIMKPADLVGWSFADFCSEFDGAQAIGKVTTSRGDAILCGTPEILATVIKKNPNAVVIDSADQWAGSQSQGELQGKKIILTFKLFGQIVGEFFPHRLTEMFTEEWSRAMEAVSEGLPGAEIVEIRSGAENCPESHNQSARETNRPLCFGDKLPRG